MSRARVSAFAALALTMGLGGCAGNGATVTALAARGGGGPASDVVGVHSGFRLANVLDAPGSLTAAGLAEQPKLRRNSGTALQVSDTTPAAHPSCITLTTNIWSTASGLSGPSFAQAGFRSDGKRGIEMDEGVDVYPAATAAQFIDVLARVAGQCRRFADRQLKDELTITSTTRFTDVGQGGLRIVVDSRDYVNLFVLEAVRWGNAIVTTLGAADTAKVAQGLAHAAATRIVTRLRALR